jgi:hypothetical protein
MRLFTTKTWPFTVKMSSEVGFVAFLGGIYRGIPASHPFLAALLLCAGRRDYSANYCFAGWSLHLLQAA